ncbi:MAG: hypothetical protein WD939_03745 [Dehalococcoidia bacterium]
MLAIACNDGATQPVPGPTQHPGDAGLAALASLFDETEFSASYRMSAGGMEGVLTWHQQGRKVRGDFAGEVNGQAVDIVVIPGPGYPNEEFVYVCRQEDERCIESRSQSEQEAYPNGEFPVVLGSTLVGAAEFAEAVTVTATSQRTIAGEEATCFVGQGIGGSLNSGEACVTEDGVVLSLREERGTGTTSLEATTFTRDVSEDLFELPYP